MNHVLFVNENSKDIFPLISFAEHKGIKVSTAYTVQEALSILQPNQDIDVVITDFSLPDGTGLELLKGSQNALCTSPAFYLMAKKSEKDIIKHAKDLGAQGCLNKPLTVRSMEKIFDSVVASTEKNTTASQTSSPYNFGNMVGDSRAMRHLYRLIERVAATSASVFVIGKSGTGKELIAQAIHQYSTRHAKPYIAINCAAISSELICSALFGHEKGSFTGAVQSHTGYFEQASGGTLFLDEITETSLDFQVKLLRLLETGIVMPVGGKRQIKVDVRIIASTNRCPKSAVKKGLFREDLYYRLNVFPIRVPLLNEREDDIELLARHFLEVNNEMEKKNISFTADALELIKKLRYAGNVRELKNLINRAYILADKEIDMDHIKIHSLAEDNNATTGDMLQIPVGVTLKNAKERFIKFTLEHCGRDYKLAANVLGISEAELANFLEFFGE